MTFIELLVSVVLLGVAGIAVLTALTATVKASGVHDDVATAQAQLADAGDVLADVTYDATDPDGDPYWVDCTSTDHPGDYTAKLTADWPSQAASFPDVVVTDVQFWNGSDWQVACVTDAMQRLTLRASVGDHTRELAVVKRKATQATGPGGAWDDEMVTPLPNPGF